jgi:hypothetical protein
MKRLILLAAGLVLSTGTALAHHGWSEYQSDKPLDLTGTIEQAGYEQPHGFVRLKTTNKTWLVVLAPPSRLESRGLAKNQLVPGTRASVHGYPHRSRAGELRAETITIEGKTTELR